MIHDARFIEAAKQASARIAVIPGREAAAQGYFHDNVSVTFGAFKQEFGARPDMAGYMAVVSQAAQTNAELTDAYASPVVTYSQGPAPVTPLDSRRGKTAKGHTYTYG